VEDNKARADRRGALQSFECVSFGQASGGGTGIGKFVGVGMGAKNLDGDGAKVVEHLDFWGLTRLVGS
jgi:hypothetical protein